MNTKLFIVSLLVSLLFKPISSQAVDWKISGQVNQAVIFGGDVLSDKDENYAIVDNDASGSRFRFKGSQELSNGLTAGFRYELQDQDNVSKTLADREDTAVRYSDIYIAGKFGKLSLGKGDGAANKTFEAYGDICTLCGAKAIKLFSQATGAKYNYIDGTSRENRIRYDSPKFNGFSFAASLDNGDREEVAVKYLGNVADGELSFYLGNVSGEDITSGSVAYKHRSGFGITYSDGKKGKGTSKSTSDWLMASYSFGKNDITLGQGEYNNNEATIFSYRFKPIKGMEIYFNYLDFENAAYYAEQENTDAFGVTTTSSVLNPSISGDGFALGSRIKF